MAPEIELTNESHELAKAWVNRNWNASAKLVRYADPVTRPARLGLGAKFVPHKAEADGALGSAARIDAKLRKDLGISAADGAQQSPRRALDGRVHRTQPGWAKGVDMVQDGSASSSSDSEDDDASDSRTSSLGRGAPRAKQDIARGPGPSGRHNGASKRDRDSEGPPASAGAPPPKRKPKRGPVVMQAAPSSPSTTGADGAALSASQRKKQRRRQRQAAAAAADAAAKSRPTAAGASVPK